MLRISTHDLLLALLIAETFLVIVFFIFAVRLEYLVKQVLRRIK
ncbi:hypothetical protein ES703_44798 [subsurface metagenome]